MSPSFPKYPNSFEIFSCNFNVIERRWDELFSTTKQMCYNNWYVYYCFTNALSIAGYILLLNIYICKHNRSIMAYIISSFICINMLFAIYIVEFVISNYLRIKETFLFLVLHFEIYWVYLNMFTNIPIYQWKVNPTVLQLDIWSYRVSLSLYKNWTHTIDTLHQQSPIIVSSVLDQSAKYAI